MSLPPKEAAAEVQEGESDDDMIMEGGQGGGDMTWDCEEKAWVHPKKDFENFGMRSLIWLYVYSCH